MNQLVAAAKNLKDRLKIMEKENDRLEKENEMMKTELESSQRYAKLVDEKYHDLCQAEEQANLKVLTLLDDVQRLTRENQELLELQRQLTGIQLTEPSRENHADSTEQQQLDYTLTPGQEWP